MKFLKELGYIIATILWIALILLLTILASPKAFADELPKSFVYHYTPTVNIRLFPDVCDKSDQSKGWIAEATDGDHKATGCWMHLKDTVLIQLEDSEGNYLDYEFYNDKFEAEY